MDDTNVGTRARSVDRLAGLTSSHESGRCRGDDRTDLKKGLGCLAKKSAARADRYRLQI